MGLDQEKIWSLQHTNIEEVLRSLPPKGFISEENWERIHGYYMKNAPDSLEHKNLVTQDMVQFTPGTSSLSGIRDPFITLIDFNDDNGDTFIGTRLSKLFLFRKNEVVRDSFMLDSPPAHIQYVNRDSVLVLTMGVMDPNDQFEGQLVALNTRKHTQRVLIDSLKRPVHFVEHDMDNDGDKDLIISCFGNFRGSLLVFEATKDGFDKHVVHSLPGTRRVFVRDVNSDGKPDLVALITQGDEQMTAFINNGNFKFQTKILKRFPPVFGSSDFNMLDFDKDGIEDIVYCNGDNADFSRVLKPYHGIRIFLGREPMEFEDSHFLQMDGVFDFAIEDFDGDGDNDIAAVAYFPDFSNSQTSFVYFENNKSSFTPFSVASSSSGRWITLETGDFDGDSDIDLVLGALNLAQGVPEEQRKMWSENKISVLLLKNNLVR